MKAFSRGKFVALSNYIKKRGRYTISNLIIFLNILEEDEKAKLHVRRWKKRIQKHLRNRVDS